MSIKELEDCDRILEYMWQFRGEPDKVFDWTEVYTSLNIDAQDAKVYWNTLKRRKFIYSPYKPRPGAGTPVKLTDEGHNFYDLDSFVKENDRKNNIPLQAGQNITYNNSNVLHADVANNTKMNTSPNSEDKPFYVEFLKEIIIGVTLLIITGALVHFKLVWAT